MEVVFALVILVFLGTLTFGPPLILWLVGTMTLKTFNSQGYLGDTNENTLQNKDF